MNFLNKDQIEYCNITILVVFFISFAIPILFTPRLLDDYWYSFTLRPWFEAQNITNLEAGGDILKYPEFLDYYKSEIYYRFVNDNIRLGNIIAPILLAFPSWVGRVMCLGAFILIIFLSFKISGVKLNNSKLLVIGLLGFIYFLPWHDHMFVLNYMLNYFISSVLALSLIYCLFISKKAVEEPVSIRKYVGICCLALLTGAWHEGISCPVFGSLILLSLLFPKYRTKIVIVAEIGLAIGIIYLAFSPGIHQRASGISLHTVFFSNLLSCLKQAILYILTLVFILFYSFRKKGNFLLRDKLILFLIFNGILAYMVVFAVKMNGRAGWWGELSSIVLLLRCLNYFGPKYFNSGNLFKLSFSSFLLFSLLIFSFVRLGLGDYYTLKFRNLVNQSIQNYYLNPLKPVFLKVYETKDLSPMAFYFPYQRFPNHCFTFIDTYTRNRAKGWDGLMYVIPEELKDVSTDTGSPIDGDLGIRIKDGYMFMPCAPTTPYSVQLMVDYGNGPEAKNAQFYQFISEKDGKRYAYVEVYSNWIDTYLRNIISISGPIKVLGMHPEYYDWEIGITDIKPFVP